MIRVLFVCLGNICRSPMAEAIFKEIITQKGLIGQLKADSAGTAAYHIGESPDPRTIATLEKRKIKFSHQGRQIKHEDAFNFDYIIAMDSANYHDLKGVLPDSYKNLFLMRDFDQSGKGEDVPDPYFGGNDGFEHVYQMLERSLQELLEHIRKEHNISS